ncbi:hypothetical protein PQQ63_26025 [Paraburkholderia metrosideri]|uniref:Uncharacterized protein n=1 Tax=Paraburkholderia metrosideri TaxID=580937 RepID=A0ABW9E1W7_9BURK
MSSFDGSRAKASDKLAKPPLHDSMLRTPCLTEPCLNYSLITHRGGWQVAERMTDVPMLRLRKRQFPDQGPPTCAAGVRILGEFFFGPTDKPAGIFIFASEGVLSGIEVYGLATDAPAALPREEALRPFPSSSGESSPADGS